MANERVPVNEYQVTGTTPFAGHQPGETFKATLDPDTERRAVERGSLKVVKPKTKKEEASDG